MGELDKAVERIAATTEPPAPEVVTPSETPVEVAEKAIEEETKEKPKKEKAKTEAKPTIKEYACPYCNNIFSAETTGVPIEVYCPTCNERVTVM